MSDNTGGPAFPSNRDMRHSPDWDYEQGMTLRDYFAAKAMQGLLACGEAHDEHTAPITAEAAYAMADDMLKEREGNNA